MAMARPCHRCDRYCDSCEDDATTLEDLYGVAALFSLVVEAGVEQAIEASGEKPSNEAQDILEVTRKFRKLALQEAQVARETQNKAEIRRIKQRILRAERLLNKAKEDLREALDEEDTSDDLSVEIFKALLKEALKDKE